MAKKWQCVEVRVWRKDRSTVPANLRSVHKNLATALNELGVSPGEVLVPLPTQVEIPSSISGLEPRNSFIFHILVYLAYVEALTPTINIDAT